MFSEFVGLQVLVQVLVFCVFHFILRLGKTARGRLTWLQGLGGCCFLLLHRLNFPKLQYSLMLLSAVRTGMFLPHPLYEHIREKVPAGLRTRSCVLLGDGFAVI